MKKTIALGLFAAVALTASPAFADNAMQVCGAKYQAAKKANTLPAGQTWAQYLAQCRASMAPAPKPAVAAAAAPASHPRTAPRQDTPAMQAMHERQRQCGAQWKADKAAHKIPANMGWPQYWSQCNARMKGH